MGLIWTLKCSVFYLFFPSHVRLSWAYLSSSRLSRVLPFKLMPHSHTHTSQAKPMWKLNKLASGYSWMGTKTPKKKKIHKNQVFWEEITFGFLGISSGSYRISRSSDSCARWRRLGTHHKRKELLFFPLLCFSQIKNKKKKPHQPSEWIWFKIKALEFQRERAKGYWPIWLLLLLLFWTGYLLLCCVNVLTF